MKLIYKIWLYNCSGIAFGEGPYQLLREVGKTGSLRKAAAVMGMSYSKARYIIKSCENNLGFALTDRKRGGVSGGGTTVTGNAIELMRLHESLRTEIENTLGEIFGKHFGQSVPVQYCPIRKQYKKPANAQTANEPVEE